MASVGHAVNGKACRIEWMLARPRIVVQPDQTETLAMPVVKLDVVFLANYSWVGVGDLR